MVSQATVLRFAYNIGLRVLVESMLRSFERSITYFVVVWLTYNAKIGKYI